MIIMNQGAIILTLIGFKKSIKTSQIVRNLSYVNKTKSIKHYNYIQVMQMQNEQKQGNYLSHIPQVLQFRAQHKDAIQNYRKAVPIKQFNQISDQRIRHQFQILNCSSFIKKQFFCLEQQKMNRYYDIVPFQHNRVKIQHIQNYYLNANNIYSIVDGKQFAVFSQAPKAPFDSFWQAIYWKNIHTIVMLCQLSDFEVHWNQADQYWPDESDQELQLKQAGLSVKFIKEEKIKEDLTFRTFQIRGAQGKKIVEHYHWTGWTDLQAPGQHTMEIVQKLLTLNIQLIKQGKPLWIHCSAGIGRTGTLGALTDAIKWVQQKKQISIYALIEHLRRQRIYCIQTFGQYAFLYKFMRKYLDNKQKI